jgi:hypothetical protein
MQPTQIQTLNTYAEGQKSPSFSPHSIQSEITNILSMHAVLYTGELYHGSNISGITYMQKATETTI